MGRVRVTIARAAALFRRRRLEEELHAELQVHLEMDIEDRVGRGMPRDEARQAARRSLGDPLKVTELWRDARGFTAIDELVQDIRYSVRILRRAPGFTSVAVLTLALGIGANTAVFSVADAAVFRPLPYRSPERLAYLRNVVDAGTPRQSFRPSMPPDKVDAWGEQTHVLEGTAHYSVGNMQLAEADGEFVGTGLLSAEVLDLLGVSPMLGRGFDAAETVSGADAVVLVSHRLWTTTLASNPAVLGMTLTLDQRPHVIVGVMPPTFRFPVPDTQVWVPLTGGRDFVYAVARVRPGLSIAEAQDQLVSTADRLQRDRPRDGGWRARLEGLDAGRLGVSDRLGLWALLAAVGVVLLIACANIAGLLLARTVARQQELAVRSSLGASRARLFRHVLAEGLVLGTAGGIVAVLAGGWSIDALSRAFATAGGFAMLEFDVELNRRVLAFAVLATCVAGLACAALPAIRASRLNVFDAPTATNRAANGTRRRHRMQDALVVVQVAATLILLVGAALLANSFARMLLVDPGFETRDLAAVSVRLSAERYASRAARDAFFDDVLHRVRSLPGVRAATAGGRVPPEDGVFGRGLEVEGYRASPGDPPVPILVTPVDPDYLETLGIPVLEGRPFGAADTAGAPPVVMIDRGTADEYWPAASALGRRLRTGPSAPWLTVVGVVGPVEGRDFAAQRRERQAYVPMSQSSITATRTIAARAAGDAGPLAGAIRGIARAVDPTVRVRSAATVEAGYAQLMSPTRVVLTLMGLFATLALGLAAVGLYGVVSYAVTRRTHEIGIRTALGATPAGILTLMMGRGVALGLAGGGIGLAGALLATRFIRSLLFQVRPTDPATLVLTSLILMLAVALACYIPARRATKLDPVAALRAE